MTYKPGHDSDDCNDPGWSEPLTAEPDGPCTCAACALLDPDLRTGLEAQRASHQRRWYDVGMDRHMETRRVASGLTDFAADVTPAQQVSDEALDIHDAGRCGSMSDPCAICGNNTERMLSHD